MENTQLLQSFRGLMRGFALALAALSLSASPINAAETSVANQEPHEIVSQVTEKMFAVVEKYDGEESDSDAYYSEIEQLLEPVVNFPFIARVVMGSHGEDATEQQIKKFAKVFKKGLVRSYAKGIASYADSEITVVPSDKEVAEARRVTVSQEVRHEGSVHNLYYTMQRNSGGEWKLINVILDGVNLGRTFRSQFSQAMKKHDGNVDKVISTWLDGA